MPHFFPQDIADNLNAEGLIKRSHLFLFAILAGYSNRMLNGSINERGLPSVASIALIYALLRLSGDHMPTNTFVAATGFFTGYLLAIAWEHMAHMTSAIPSPTVPKL
jgi:hypothetical protein